MCKVCRPRCLYRASFKSLSKCCQGNLLLCLQSLAAHWGHFVLHLSVCLSACLSVCMSNSNNSYVSKVTYAFLRMLPLFLPVTSRFCGVVEVTIIFWLGLKLKAGHVEEPYLSMAKAPDSI